jgi:hypothetical protein
MRFPAASGGLKSVKNNVKRRVKISVKEGV